MRLILILLGLIIVVTVAAKRKLRQFDTSDANNAINDDKFCTSVPEGMKTVGAISIWAFFDPTDPFIQLQAKKYQRIARYINVSSKDLPSTTFYSIVPDLKDYNFTSWQTVMPILYDFGTVIDDENLEIWYDFNACKDHIIIVNSCGLVREQFTVDWKAPGLTEFIKNVILKVHNRPCNCPWAWPNWDVEISYP